MSEQENEIFMEEAEYLEYISNQMREKGSSTPVAQLNMYDMNKDIVRSLKKMTNMEINNALEKVKEWYEQDDKHLIYALLNHEQHYFTIFFRHHDASNAAKSFITQLKDILTNWYGDNDLRAIDIDSNGAIEVWGMWDGEPSVGYLFPYDEGVVYY